MPRLSLEVDFKSNDKLVDAMSKTPQTAEKAVNDVLRTKGGPEIIRSILKFMPVSNKKKGAHAKFSNSIKAFPINLGLRITRSTKRWSYLVFPNDGIGIRNKRKQEFFERGLEDATDRVMDMMLDALAKEL